MVEMGPVLPHADPISREIVMTNTSEAPLEIYSTDFDAAYLEEEEVLVLENVCCLALRDDVHSQHCGHQLVFL